MTEKFEYKGLWFLPGNTSDEVAGTLFFDPFNQIRLDLTGTLTEFSDNLDELNIILGTTVNGKKITLVKCRRTNQSASFPGILTAIYNADFILEGEHFFSIDDINFYKISAKITKLEEWVDILGFNVKTSNTGVDLKFEVPRNILFYINEDVKGSFTFSGKRDNLLKSSYKIEQTTKVELILKEEMEYNTLLDMLTHFRLFVALGVFTDVNSDDIEFYSKSITHEYSKEMKVETPIRFYRLQILKSNKVLKQSSSNFLFTYKKIEANFDFIIQKWFNLKDSIAPVLNTLFEIFSDKTIYIESRFLHIVQALEVYHRRIKQDREELINKFNKSLNPILAKLDEDQKKWLKEKIGYSYEPRLRKMLDQLFKEFKIHPLSKIANSKGDIYRLIVNATDSRNYYTHYNPDLKEKACHGQDLYLLSEKLKVLLIIVILRETGFEAKEIEDLFSRNGWVYFNHIMKEY